MIEVNLYKLPTAGVKESLNVTSIARSRFDKEGMGTSVEEFVIRFLRDSFEKLQDVREINGILESNRFMTRMDLECINNLLVESGYRFEVYNVTDDEENPNGVPSGETIELNIINKNNLQDDYPTCIKMIPGLPLQYDEIFRKIIEDLGLYNTDKFPGVKNPFSKWMALLNSEATKGKLSISATSNIYRILNDHNIDILWVASEN